MATWNISRNQTILHDPKERVLPMLECIGERIFDFGESPWNSSGRAFTS
jgi:hypothetical protein